MNYEIRLFRWDGSLSLIMNTEATGERDARMQALQLIQGDIAKATVSSSNNVLHSYCRVRNWITSNDNASDVKDQGLSVDSLPTSYFVELH